MSDIKYAFIPFEQVTEDEKGYANEERVRAFPLRVIGARLWAEKINTVGGNGETDPFRAALDSVLMSRLADAHAITPEQRDAFARSVIDNGAKVLKYVDSWHKGPGVKYNYTVIDELSVDYGPNVGLAACAFAADLNPDHSGLWRIKSSVDIQESLVRARFEYRGASAFYYPREDGQVFVAPMAFYKEQQVLLDWIIQQDTLAPGCSWAPWNWKDYARTLGYTDGDFVASPPSPG